MDLQLALLVAGAVVIVVVVAFSLYERKRRRRSGRMGSEDDGDVAGVLRLRTPHTTVPSATLTFDVNPAPDTAIERRSLKPDALLSPEEPNKFDAITQELEVLEDVAQVPLNLGAAPARPDEKPSTPAAPDEKIDFILSLPGEGRLNAIPRSVFSSSTSTVWKNHVVCTASTIRARSGPILRVIRRARATVISRSRFNCWTTAGRSTNPSSTPLPKSASSSPMRYNAPPSCRSRSKMR